MNPLPQIHAQNVASNRLRLKCFVLSKYSAMESPAIAAKRSDSSVESGTQKNCGSSFVSFVTSVRMILRIRLAVCRTRQLSVGGISDIEKPPFWLLEVVIHCRPK